MDVAPDVLTDDELYQLGALDAFCRVAGDRVRYVNPHEAHYNTVVEDPVRAGAVVRPVAEACPALPCPALPGSALRSVAAALPAGDIRRDGLRAAAAAHLAAGLTALDGGTTRAAIGSTASPSTSSTPDSEDVPSTTGRV